VFRGQDAWRKHPLLHNLSNNPFPHLRTAVVLFAGYCAVELYFKIILAPPPSPYKPKVVYTQDWDTEENFDKQPVAKIVGKHH